MERPTERTMTVRELIAMLQALGELDQDKEIRFLYESDVVHVMGDINEVEIAEDHDGESFIALCWTD